MVLFVFQFYPVCNFGKCINFGLGTVSSEMVKESVKNALQKSRKVNLVFVRRGVDGSLHC